MRQVEHNAKLTTLVRPEGMKGTDRQIKDNYGGLDIYNSPQPLDDCFEKVPSCGKELPGDGSCHRFYKCIGGAAYSCQSPKLGFSTCSGKYFSIGKGREHYGCKAYTQGGNDPCKK